MDLHGFCEWVFDSLGLLNDFLRQVVVSGRDSKVDYVASGGLSVLGRTLVSGLILFLLPHVLLSRILRLSHLGF